MFSLAEELDGVESFLLEDSVSDADAAFSFQDEDQGEAEEAFIIGSRTLHTAIIISDRPRTPKYYEKDGERMVLSPCKPRREQGEDYLSLAWTMSNELGIFRTDHGNRMV